MLTLTVCAVTIPNLKRIVNAAWALENFDTLILSRYMRSLFQYTLPHGDNVAEDLLDQIYTLAQGALGVSDWGNFRTSILITYRVNNLTPPKNLNGSPQWPLIERSIFTVLVKIFFARHGRRRLLTLQAAVLMEDCKVFWRRSSWVWAGRLKYGLEGCTLG